MGRVRSGVRSGVVLAAMAMLVAAIVGIPATITASPAAALTPAAYESEVLADGPVSWWPLDEPSGSVARDVTGPNQGYVQGGVTPGVDGPFGGGSTAFRFNGGACSGVDVGRDPGSLAPQAFTIENWFRTDTANRGIMFRWRNYGYGYTSGNGGLTIDGHPGGHGTGLAGGEGAADGEWHHGVAQWTGNGWVLYLDGVKVGEQAASGNLVYGGSHAVAIGRDANACDGSVPSFKGDIAQVAFYDHALPEDRVKAHYCAGVPTAPGCGAGLTSVAGPDQSIAEGSAVVLDGTASHGPDSVAGSGTATTGLGGRLFATGGPVEVEVRPASTGITSQLWLFEPEAKRQQIATNRDLGQSYQVGSFAAGDELVFGIANGDVQFRMGPGDRNPDLIEHAKVVEIEPGVYDVGFEDHYGGGDRGYDDNVFRFRGAVAAAQPLTYRWDLVSAQGPPVQLSDPTSAQPSFVAFDDGRYTFRLTVSDGLVTATDEVTVTVTNQVPVVTRAEAGPTATDGLAQVAVGFTDPGAFDTHTVRFDWGDGTPIEDVAAAVNGSGWGYSYAGHVYATTGDKTVMLTVVDDDGGVSQPASTTFNVGAAGQGEPAPGAALWASSQSVSDAIRISGSANNISGLTHSNDGIRVTGSNHRFTGATEYRTTVSVSGSRTVFDPPARQVPAAAAPYSFNVADYQPGGRAALSVGARYTAIAPAACKGGKWKPTKPIATGLIYVPCGVQISGSDVAGEVTIAATGDIKVTGSAASFTPFIDGLLFLSTSSTGTKAIDLSGSRHVLHGSLYAANGGIELTGSESTLDCGVVAQTVRISGSNNSVSGTNCGSRTAGGTPVAVAAPPLLVSNTAATLTVDKTSVFPGETVTYEASVGNASAETGGASLFMPVQLGADNRGASPVTVTGTAYRLEIHDPTTNTWSTVATTDPAAPAEQRIATLTARPNPTTGVIYPAGPDTISGTQVSPGKLGSWAGNVHIVLNPDQLALLLDPARVDAIRSTVGIATDGLLVRKIARFSADPLAELRAAPQADISDVHLNLTRPGAAPETIDASTVPALATLTPGESASVKRTATAATPDVKAVGESDDSYLARLTGLDGTGLFATAYATGSAGVGRLIAPQQMAKATVNVPVVSAVVSAPSAVNAGDPATWTVELTNAGSATATNLDLRLDVGGVGALTLDGAPSELAPGAHATVTATTATTAGATTTLVGTAALRWSHPGGTPAMYGPVGGQVQLTSRPPVALAVTKFASTGSSTPPGQIQYNLDIANSGTTALTGVVLDDPIDDNALIADATLISSAGTIVTGTSSADRSVGIGIGELAVDAHVTVTFRVDYAAATPGTTQLINQATATSDQLPPVLSDDPYLAGAADPTVTSISTGSGGGGGTDPGPTLQGCNPGDTATVTAPTLISCTLVPQAGTTVTSWRLSVQPLGAPDSEQHVLATGTGTNVAGTIDPTVLANGLYTVRIVARGSDNAASRLETTLVVDGNLKLGRYAVTYQDMAVPVGGIPIQVNRSYDTLDKDHVGDFGHGWRLDVANFRSQANRPLGAGGYEQYECDVAVLVVVYCLQPTMTHAVTVTWPEGRTETFDLTPQKSPPAFSFLSPVAYTGRPGTTSKLEPAPGDQYAMYVGDGNLYVPLEANLYNPTRFTLVAKGGTHYLLDTATGLVEAADRNSNTITVTADGVRSSLGPAISFDRDLQGRIETITGPGGQQVSYDYDVAGDLTTATDANGHATRFEYVDHNLTKTIDAANRPFQQQVYDSDGRLEAIIDANANRTEITNDISSRTQTITSPDGRKNTISSFDDRGNETHRNEIYDGVSHMSSWNYTSDGRDLVISWTDPAGNTASVSYDAKGDPTSYTDPSGDRATFTVNDFGQLLESTDPAGATTTMSYDAAGRLATYTDPTSGSSTFGYDSRGLLTSRTDPLGATWTWSYSAEGMLVSDISPEGRERHWTYDSAGRVATMLAGVGMLTSYGYDQVGNLTSVIDPLGRQTNYVYDPQDQLISETNPAGETKTYVYGEVGNLIETQDATAATTSYAYDAMNRVVTATDPLGHESSYDYDGAGHLVTSRDLTGLLSTFAYDVAGRLTSATRPGSGTTSYTYDELNRMLTRTDSLGHTTHYGYGPAGQVASVTDPNDQTTTWTYDLAGRPTSSTNPAGEQITATYDAAGRIDTVADPFGAVWHYSFDDDGLLVGVTDPLGHGQSRAYDNRGLLASVTDGAGGVTLVHQDAASQLTSIIDPAGLVESYSYDDAGRIVQASDALGNQWHYGYDAAGRRTSETDARGNITSWTYDPAGRLTRITDALGGTVGFGYDAAGRSTSLVDPNGQTSSYTYGPNGLVATATDPLARTTTYGYDSAGQLTSRADGNAMVTSYGYDSAGQLVSEIRPEGPVSYTYDPAGRRTGTSYPGGTQSATYDSRGNLTEFVTPEGVVGYSYDGAGRRALMTIPAGTIAYQYDNADRITGASWSGQDFDLTLRPNGQIAQIHRANGVVTNYGYDDAGRVVGIAHDGPTGAIASFDYTLDANGNRTGVDDTVSGTSDSYVLDSLNRLTSADYGDGTSEAFSYDAAGNRIGRTDQDAKVTTYSYDQAGQLAGTDSPEGQTTYRYDGAANTISVNRADNTTTYSWNSRNLLVGSTSALGNHTYTYDADGIRTSVDGAAQLWDRASTLPTLVGNATRGYLHLNDQVVASGTTAPDEWMLSDALGSIRGVTDDTGSITATARYQAFGTPLTTNAATFGYTGEQTDTGGLVHLRARQYNPATARFVSPDPIRPGASGTGGANQYSYANNNPTTATDPTGHVEFIERAFNYTQVLAVRAQLWYTGSTAAVCIKGAAENIGEGVVAGGASPAGVAVDGVIGCALEWITEAPSRGATRAGGGVSNPAPDRLARVVDADFIDSPTIGGPGGGDVFVTAADDIAGMSSAEIGQRLTLLDAAGKPRTGPFAVLEFDTPASDLASPINRTNPGFVQGGRTGGGAREFVFPNMSTDDLLNLIRRQAG